MLLTQLRSIAIVRESTGLSITAATKIVRSLATVQDGKRWKCRESDIRAEIAKANAPATRIPMKPISEAQRQRI